MFYIPIRLSISNATLRSFYPGMLILPTVIEVPRIKSVSSSVMEFRLTDFFSEKNIVGPHGVPDPPSLAQMTFTQCTSMSELKIDPGAPPGGQI